MSTKIICRANKCIFWENKICISEEIIYDPEEGCLTYEVIDLEKEEALWANELLTDDELDWDDDDVQFEI